MLDLLSDKVITAYWRNRPLLASEAFAQIEAFLRRLHADYPVFAELYIATRKGYSRIDSDFSNLQSELIAIMDPETRYINDDAEDDAFSLDCRTPNGFHASFTNAGHEAAQTVGLSITCGEISRPASFQTSPNYAILSMSPEVETTKLLRDLFEEAVMFWRPTEAALTSPGVRNLLNQPAGQVRPGWLTYITHPGAASSLPPDIVYRPFADGVLIQAADHPGREDNPDYVRRVLHVRDTLGPLGFLAEIR